MNAPPLRRALLGLGSNLGDRAAAAAPAEGERNVGPLEHLERLAGPRR